MSFPAPLPKLCDLLELGDGLLDGLNDGLGGDLPDGLGGDLPDGLDDLDGLPDGLNDLNGLPDGLDDLDGLDGDLLYDGLHQRDPPGHV